MKKRKNPKIELLEQWSERAARLIVEDWVLMAKIASGKEMPTDADTAQRLYREREALLIEALGREAYELTLANVATITGQTPAGVIYQEKSQESDGAD